MTLVAFDPSTPATVVAVEEGGEVLSRHLPAPPDSHPAHSTELLAAAAGLLEEAGSGGPAVARIGVGTGRGPCTGVRLSAATAGGVRRAPGA
ncbi:MAG: tRNA (adenosine(37)-N6)-threonylcarbamoyltransferase complex dimerization subunit type 1 TsaB, partial [Solirubrobacterales bacterium]